MNDLIPNLAKAFEVLQDLARHVIPIAEHCGRGCEISTAGGVRTPMLSHSIMSAVSEVSRRGLPAKTIFEVLLSGAAFASFSDSL